MPDQPHAHHHGHSHAPSADADRRLLAAALALLICYLVTEVIVAILTNSLALLSDAAHMLTDVGSIALALWAMYLTKRPARGVWTYGWKRAEILSGLGNGLTLILLGALLLVQALSRAVHPEHIDAGPVLATALAGITINLFATWLLAKANRSSLNVEGAYQHIVTDLYGFLGTAVAAVIMMVTDWYLADTVATLIVVGLMLRSGWGLVRSAGRVLLEAAPPGISIDEVRSHLIEVDHVIDVHDLHVWTVSSDMPAVSAHLVLDDRCFVDGQAPRLLDHAMDCLQSHFDVEHSTLQLEPTSHSAHEVGAHA